MRFATRQEIEYLGSLDAKTSKDSDLIDEMSRRLDALRRYDQLFSDSDWRPAEGHTLKTSDRRKSR
jgi:hypothetical protein